MCMCVLWFVTVRHLLRKVTFSSSNMTLLATTSLMHSLTQDTVVGHCLKLNTHTHTFRHLSSHADNHGRHSNVFSQTQENVSLKCKDCFCFEVWRLVAGAAKLSMEVSILACLAFWLPIYTIFRFCCVLFFSD